MHRQGDCVLQDRCRPSPSISAVTAPWSASFHRRPCLDINRQFHPSIGAPQHRITTIGSVFPNISKPTAMFGLSPSVSAEHIPSGHTFPPSPRRFPLVNSSSLSPEHRRHAHRFLPLLVFDVGEAQCTSAQAVASHSLRIVPTFHFCHHRSSTGHRSPSTALTREGYGCLLFHCLSYV